MARRRRDGRRNNENLPFIAFSPSVIFDKMTAPSSEGACVGQPQGLSLRYDIKFNLIATAMISCRNLLLYKILQNNLIDTIKANS